MSRAWSSRCMRADGDGVNPLGLVLEFRLGPEVNRGLGCLDMVEPLQFLQHAFRERLPLLSAALPHARTSALRIRCPLGLTHGALGFAFGRGDVAGSRLIARQDRNLTQSVVLVKERHDRPIDSPAHGQADDQGEHADYHTRQGERRPHLSAGVRPRRKGPEDRQCGSSRGQHVPVSAAQIRLP